MRSGNADRQGVHGPTLKYDPSLSRGKRVGYPARNMMLLALIPQCQESIETFRAMRGSATPGSSRRRQSAVVAEGLLANPVCHGPTRVTASRRAFL